MAAAKAQASAGGDSNLKAAAAYLPVFWPLIPLFLFLTEKEDKAVRFHSLQCILFGLIAVVVMFVVFIVLWVITMVLGIVTGGLAFILTPLLALLGLGLGLLVLLFDLFLMWKAYQGEKYVIPVIGGFDEKYV
jgi:uncharacterized membrane protein